MQCNAMQCNAVQCSAVQCSAVQCSAVQCSAVQCSAVQCSAVQCSAVQCTALHCTALTTLISTKETLYLLRPYSLYFVDVMILSIVHLIVLFRVPLKIGTGIRFRRTERKGCRRDVMRGGKTVQKGSGQ
jgi:hypothetical protein